MIHSKSFFTEKHRKIMFYALLVALSASLIATIIIAESYVNVTLLTSPDGVSMRAQGEPFNVSCEGAGGETEKFSFLKWMKNGEEEITDGDPSTAKIGNKLFLKFKNPKSGDGGYYLCSAVYDKTIQLVEKIFLVFYGTKPEFRVTFENVALEAGKSEYLTCEAEGEKPIEYKWYNQDEDRITDDINQPVYASYHTSYSRLNFKSLSTEHEGSYTCTASNTHGLASKVYNLKVSSKNDGNDTDKGNVTTGFRDAKVLKYTTTNVTFYITTSGPIQYIEVKYREGQGKGASSTITRLDPAPGNTYEIGNLFPSGLYSFQFRTVPSESDDWSRMYNVTLYPSTPEIIMQNIGDSNVRLQWFMTTDERLRGTIDRYQIKYYTVESVGGNSWTSKDCSVTIEVPTCIATSYTIWGLRRMIFYQIEVRAHTEAGYGEPARQKVNLV